MATRNIYTDSGILPSDDSAATASTVMTRDGSGDSIARRFTMNRAIITGGTQIASSAKTANYTATRDDTVLIVDATSGAVTVTLPAVSTSTGMLLWVKKVDGANNVILDGNASETIDGATTKTLNTQYQSRLLYCDGSVWHILSANG